MVHENTPATAMVMTPTDQDQDQERERELNISLSESLTCRTCTIHLPKATYQRHLQSRIYVPTRDPPFRLSRAEVNGLIAFRLSPSSSSSSSPDGGSSAESENRDQISPGSKIPSEDDYDHDREYDCDYDDETTIAPHATPPPRRRPGYQALMTTTQREAYQTRIAKYAAESEGTGRDDLALAKYHVDYHVHLHWLSRRGALTLCRDVKEMHELRRWRWKMAQMDVQAMEEERGRGKVEESENENENETNGTRDEGKEGGMARRRTRNVAVRRWGWPGDSHLFMMYQTALWRQKWMVRQKHLDEVRVRWAVIMEERQRQRKCVKVKLFWGHGYKNLLREIELEEPWFGEHIIR